jgi:hypothetical protein
MPYDLRTNLVGVFARHADACRSRDGEPCSCGPLGYRAGIWDWHATRWVISALVRTTEEAQEWQRAANRLAEGAGPPGPPPVLQPPGEDDSVKASERFFWWIFCYVGLAFLGVGLALFASDVAG